MNFNKFKAVSPVCTVTKIKDILKRIGLRTNETSLKNPHGKIHSMRLETHMESGLFGTNGKGATFEYARASAFGEFMERLQNLLISDKKFPDAFEEKLKNEHGYYCHPDERYMGKGELLKLDTGILEDLFGCNFREVIEDYFSKSGEMRVLSLPFFDLFEGDVIYLPIDPLTMVTGSNGMCAGNTRFEALSQGLFEIFERYCASELIFKKLTPFYFDDEFLRNLDSYRIIKSIRNSGFRVMAGYFGTGKKLPVAGVVIIDEASKKYRVCLGSHSSLDIALMRALTEIYQGLCDLSIKEMMVDFDGKNGSDFDDQIENFTHFTANGTGKFPPSLFMKKPDFGFREDYFRKCANFEEDFFYYASLLKRGCNKIYIRNNSYLFDTYFIYVPGISSIYRFSKRESKTFEEGLSFENARLSELLRKVKELNEKEMDEIIPLLAKRKELNLSDLFSLEISNKSRWGRLPVLYLLSLLMIKKNDITFAENLFEEYLSLNPDSHDNALKRAFEMAKNGKISPFDLIRIPNCPNCMDCELDDDCITKGKANLFKTMTSNMKKTVEQVF